MRAIIIILCFMTMFGLFLWSCLYKYRKFKQVEGVVGFIKDLKKFVESVEDK